MGSPSPITFLHSPPVWFIKWPSYFLHVPHDSASMLRRCLLLGLWTCVILILVSFIFLFVIGYIRSTSHYLFLLSASSLSTVSAISNDSPAIMTISQFHPKCRLSILPLPPRKSNRVFVFIVTSSAINMTSFSCWFIGPAS